MRSRVCSPDGPVHTSNVREDHVGVVWGTQPRMNSLTCLVTTESIWIVSGEFHDNPVALVSSVTDGGKFWRRRSAALSTRARRSGASPRVSSVVLSRLPFSLSAGSTRIVASSGR